MPYNAIALPPGVFSAFVLVAAFLSIPLCEASNVPLCEEPLVMETKIPLTVVQVTGTHNSYHIAPEDDVMKYCGSGSADNEAENLCNTVATFNYTLPPMLEQVEAKIRNFEIDFWWHPETDSFKVIHVPRYDIHSICNDPQSCYMDIVRWSTQNEDHVPITINFEFKGRLTAQDMCKAITTETLPGCLYKLPGFKSWIEAGNGDYTPSEGDLESIGACNQFFKRIEEPCPKYYSCVYDGLKDAGEDGSVLPAFENYQKVLMRCNDNLPVLRGNWTDTITDKERRYVAEKFRTQLLTDIGEDKLIMPKHILDCPSLGDEDATELNLGKAIQKCGWPSLAFGRGKFIIGMDSNPYEDHDMTYPHHRPLDEWVAFPMFEVPSFDDKYAAWVKYNDPIVQLQNITDAVPKGFLVRTRPDMGDHVPGPEDDPGYQKRRDTGMDSSAQLLSTDYPTKKDANGNDLPQFRSGLIEPFRIAPRCSPHAIESGLCPSVLSIEDEHDLGCTQNGEYDGKRKHYLSSITDSWAFVVSLLLILFLLTVLVVYAAGGSKALLAGLRSLLGSSGKDDYEYKADLQSNLYSENGHDLDSRDEDEEQEQVEEDDIDSQPY
eukprot:Clim_evm86s210 gene=Clim_evmTU86s210